MKDIGSTYIKTYFQRQALQTCANSLKDNKLRGEVINILNDYKISKINVCMLYDGYLTTATCLYTDYVLKMFRLNVLDKLI